MGPYGSVCAHFIKMEKVPDVAPNGARMICLRPIQILPTFFVRTDLDFENSICVFVFGIPNFWILRSPDFQRPGLGLWPGLGFGPWAYSNLPSCTVAARGPCSASEECATVLAFTAN